MMSLPNQLQTVTAIVNNADGIVAAEYGAFEDNLRYNTRSSQK